MEFIDQEAQEEHLPQTPPATFEEEEEVSEEEEEEEEEGPIRPRLKRIRHVALEEEEEKAYRHFLEEKAQREKGALEDCPELTKADYTENSKPSASTLIVCSPKKKKPRRIPLETLEVGIKFIFCV